MGSGGNIGVEVGVGDLLRVTLEWKGGGWPSRGHIGVEGGWVTL